MDRTNARHGTPWHLILIFLALTAGIAGAGFAYYRMQRTHFVRETQVELTAIADLKVTQIANWRRDLLEDGNLIMHDAFVARAILDFRSQPSATTLRTDLQNWMRRLMQHYQYAEAFLVSPEGDVLLATADQDSSIGMISRSLLAGAGQQRQPRLSDLYRTPVTGAIRLSLGVPILPPDTAEGAPIALLLLRIDPQEFLYPLVESWPTPSPSAESKIVRADGDSVLFLNNLRYRPNTALSLRLPRSEREVIAVKAVGGFEGATEGVDYTHVPVVAAVRAVPDTPWYMIAKVNAAEIYAPLRRQAALIAGTIGALILAAAFGTGLAWRQQAAGFYRRQYEAEVERQALSRHYEYLTKHANDIILLLDGDLRIVEANDRAVEAYGFTREELLALTLRELRAPEASPQVDAVLQQLKTTDGLRFETLHRRKDGTLLPVEVSLRRIEIEGKVFLQEIARDITERKRAEQALRESQERLHLATEAAAIGVWVYDLARDKIAMTAQAHALFGLRPDEELTYAFFLEHLHPEDRARVDAAVARAAAEGTDYREEYRYYLPDGSLHWLLALGRAHRDEAEPDRPSRLFGVVMDTTERKRIEEEIRALNAELEERVRQRTSQLETAYEELGAANEELVTINDELEREILERKRVEDEVRRLNAGLQASVTELRATNSELEAFCYSVSHDLRAPLRAIDGFSQALLEDYASKLDDDGRRYLDRVRAGADRMSRLIDDLLNLSRITRAELSPQTVDLSALARSVMTDLARVNDDRPVDVRIADGLTAEGDPRLLRLVLQNLLDNAWKYTSKRPNPVIEFGAVREDGQTAYYVRDNGAGFDMRYAGKLFSPFQRLHGAEEFPGTGIGLATVQRIIHRHGGRIWAESAEGQGATFYFTLRPGQ